MVSLDGSLVKYLHSSKVGYHNYSQTGEYGGSKDLRYEDKVKEVNEDINYGEDLGDLVVVHSPSYEG